MGVFDVLKRLVVGEPAFEDQEQMEGKSQTGRNTMAGPSTSAYGTPRDSEGLKILPEVIVGRLYCKVEGDQMNVEGLIRNESNKRMQVVKIMIFNVVHPIDIYLDPGKERQLIIYSGPTVKDTSMNQCYLDYKNESGDYFRANHYVDFTVQPDDTYVIHEIKFIPPVQDI